MPEQIIINDTDPNKADLLEEFLGGTTKTGAYLDREVTLTDADYEDLFTKIAVHETVNSFTDFKSVVHYTFEGKLDKQVSRWEEKLALDRTRLSGLFSKKTK